MKEREELELILKLIGDFNLPLSPILDYAIRVKIDEYSEIEENDEVLETVPGGESEREIKNSLYVAVQYNNNTTNNVYYHNCKIDNKANQCFIINQNGKRIYSSSGKLKILDDKLYRIYFNNSTISINLVQWDEKKEKYKLGERLVYEKKNSSLYEHLNKNNYLEQIMAIEYEHISGKYRVNIDNQWYRCDGIDLDKDVKCGSIKDIVSPAVSSQECQSNSRDVIKIVDFDKQSIAVIGNIKSHLHSLKAMGGYFKYKTEWGPAWVYSSQKRERIQAYINRVTSIVSKLNNKKNEESFNRGSSRFIIRVRYPDGKMICSSLVWKTLVDVVNFAGPERVKQLNIICMGDNLVSSSLNKNIIYRRAQKAIGGGLFVCTYSSTEMKYRQIVRINQDLRLGLQIDKIYLDGHDNIQERKTTDVPHKHDNIKKEKLQIDKIYLDGYDNIQERKTTDVPHKHDNIKKEKNHRANNRLDVSKDRRIGYIVRLLPSQLKGVIVRVIKVQEGYKKLIIKTDDGSLKVIDDNPYLYIVLKRKR